MSKRVLAADDHQDYASSRSSEEFEHAGDAYDDVATAIGAVCSKATQPRVASQSKQNAMLALINIGQSICEADGIIGREMQKKFQYGDCLGDAMMEILASVRLEEVRTVTAPGGAQVELINILEELINNAKGYYILDSLVDVYKII